MQPALFLSLLNFSKHQTKVEMVETQDAHEAIQEYPCEKSKSRLAVVDRSPEFGLGSGLPFGPFTFTQTLKNLL